MIGMASLVQDKTEFMRTQDKINRLAYYDTLTNLPNRGLLNDRLLQSIAISKHTKTYSMIAFDETAIQSSGCDVQSCVSNSPKVR